MRTGHAAGTTTQRGVVVLVGLSILLAGCSPTPAPTPTPSASQLALTSPTSTASAPAPSATPDTGTPVPTATADAPSPSPTLTPTATPTPSPAVVEATAFTTPAPPKAGAAWTGITWRKLKSDDPLSTVRSVVRWRGGFVAVGAVVPTGQTSRTPVWVSADGVTWKPLASSVLGPTTLVIGVFETKRGLVALTVQGGSNQCDDPHAGIDCWSPSLPLQSWTSADGTTWTAHPGPTIDLPLVCTSCGVDLPLIRSGVPGVLVVNPTRGTEPDAALAAFSTDGIDWTIIPTTAFPSHFEFADVEAFRSGFIAVGDNGGMPGRGVVLWSSDGRHWSPSYLPTAGLPRDAGSTGQHVFVGPRGVIVEGRNQAAPSTAFWWTSTSGKAWRRFSGYPPLGVWYGQGVGSGMTPNGVLLGDGERLLAYRSGSGAAAWASFDGRSWRSVAVGGTRPPSAGAWAGLDAVLLPIGLIIVGPDGSVGFGQPTT